MKKLGNLFGAEVWLDITSDKIASRASNFLDKVIGKYQASKSEEDLEQEVLQVIGKKPYDSRS